MDNNDNDKTDKEAMMLVGLSVCLSVYATKPICQSTTEAWKRIGLD